MVNIVTKMTNSTENVPEFTSVYTPVEVESE